MCSCAQDVLVECGTQRHPLLTCSSGKQTDYDLSNDGSFNVFHPTAPAIELATLQLQVNLLYHLS